MNKYQQMVQHYFSTEKFLSDLKNDIVNEIEKNLCNELIGKKVEFYHVTNRVFEQGIIVAVQLHEHKECWLGIEVAKDGIRYYEIKSVKFI